MFFRQEKDPKASQAGALHKELCEALRVLENGADSELLKHMIDSYMDNAKIKVLESYITYKIRDQVATISKDKNNPLQNNKDHPHPSWVTKEDLAEHDKIIKAYLREFHLYLVTNKNDSNLVNDEDIKKIFGIMNPRTAYYIFNTCPLISKDDKGNYDFTCYTLLAKWEVEAMQRPVTFTKEDEEKINDMIGSLGRR
jgi:hypothetical protein